MADADIWRGIWWNGWWMDGSLQLLQVFVFIWKPIGKGIPTDVLRDLKYHSVRGRKHAWKRGKGTQERKNEKESVYTPPWPLDTPAEGDQRGLGEAVRGTHMQPFRALISSANGILNQHSNQTSLSVFLPDGSMAALQMSLGSWGSWRLAVAEPLWSHFHPDSRMVIHVHRLLNLMKRHLM